ncbi:hypothetical protein FRC00_005578 [Tulasnella sp. 408]|nr:hypothetical protein FRC00_005578 [Tulasnella sp. 408]
MFGKTLFTRPARDLAATPTSQFQPGPSSRHLFKRPFALLLKVRDITRLFRLSRSQEEGGGFDGLTEDNFFGQRPQAHQTGSPAVTSSDLSLLISAQAGEEDSATSTPTTFSVSPSVHSTAPTSTFTSGPSSPQSFELHPDLIAVNQRIAELEALAEQTEQEHRDYVKNAREMEATLVALEEEVVSAVDAIKAVNKKTSQEAEEDFKFSCERLEEIRHREIAEDFLKDARRTYEERQKKHAALQARFENLQREREQHRIDLKTAAPPPEPWLEIVSKAVAPNLLGGLALGVGHIIGPLISNVL